MLWKIKVAGFVEEISAWAHYKKTMRETFGYPHLFAVIGTEQCTYPAPETPRTFTQVNRNVENRSAATRTSFAWVLSI